MAIVYEWDDVGWLFVVQFLAHTNIQETFASFSLRRRVITASLA